MIQATTDQAVPLQVLLSDGRSDLYCQFKIYDNANGLVNTLTAINVGEGLYSANWTPNVEGYFYYVAKLYLDAGFTISSGYDITGELIDVSSIKLQLTRILGLHNENTVIDQQSYDSEGRLISARIRLYDSKANAQTASTTGLLETYAVAALYTGGLLTQFTTVRM